MAATNNQTMRRVRSDNATCDIYHATLPAAAHTPARRSARTMQWLAPKAERAWHSQVGEGCGRDLSSIGSCEISHYAHCYCAKPRPGMALVNGGLSVQQRGQIIQRRILWTNAACGCLVPFLCRGPAPSSLRRPSGLATPHSTQSAQFPGAAAHFWQHPVPRTPAMASCVASRSA